MGNRLFICIFNCNCHKNLCTNVNEKIELAVLLSTLW